MATIGECFIKSKVNFATARVPARESFRSWLQRLVRLHRAEASAPTDPCPRALVSSNHLKVNCRQAPFARFLLRRREIFPDPRGLPGPGSRPDHSKCARRPSCRPETGSQSRSRLQPAHWSGELRAATNPFADYG